MTRSPLTDVASDWHDVVTALGLRVLPHSSFVPIDVWLTDPRRPARVMRLLARGTTVRLQAFDSDDLAALMLRSECDCQEHRLAGAAGRIALRPGARPLEEWSYDGAADGWTGVTAGMLDRNDVAPILGRLWPHRAETRLAVPA